MRYEVFFKRKNNYGIFSLILAIFVIFHAQRVFGAMSSTNYQIQWDEFSTGGGSSSSATYREEGGSSNSEGSDLSSASYSIAQGFRAGVYDRVVEFIPYVQNSSTQVAATAFASNIVSVSTAAGFSAGDYILIVQDEGASQVSAMAKVLSVVLSPPSVTIDADYAGSTPTIDGSNDYVYEMDSTTTIALGTLASSTVTTHAIGWIATSDVNSGYSVYMFSDGNFRDGSTSIAAVSDGAVTAGSSEYGGRSSDTTLATSTFDTQDTAFTTTPALVASESSHPFAVPGFVTLKASISSSQPGGTYGQTLTAVFVGEY